MARRLTAQLWIGCGSPQRPRLIIFRVVALCFIIAGASCSPAGGATLRQRIQNASPLKTFDTEGAQVRRVQVAGQSVLFQLESQDAATIISYDLDGNRRFRYSDADAGDAPITGASLSDDGRTLIVYTNIGDSRSKATILDSAGQTRFEIENSTSLQPSPSGRYFSTLHNHVTDPQFQIYNSTGTEVTTKFAAGAVWSCQFIDDTRLVVLGSYDTLRIVDPSTGSVHSQTPVSFKSRSSTRFVVVSQFDSLVAVYDSKNLSLLSFDGNLVWTDSFEHNLYELSFSDDSHWLCLQFGIRGTDEGYIRLQSTLDPSVRVDSERLENLPDYLVNTWCERLWFRDNVVTMCAPDGMELCQIEPDHQYWTLFLPFDSESRQFGPAELVQGLYQPIPRAATDIQLLHVEPRADAAVLSIEQSGE